MKRTWMVLGATLGALAVAFGAVGSHALKDRLDPQQLENWKTAALYHALHALALVGYGLFLERDASASRAPAWCFLLGVLAFSGSLYGHALGGPRPLVYVTPVGGLLLILGWVLFAVAAARRRPIG